MNFVFSGLRLASVGIAVVLCAACGGSSSDSGPNGGLSTNVSSSKPLNTLTESEKNQLCSDLQTYVNGALTDALRVPLCRSKGIAAALQSGASNDAEARAACKPAYDKCLTEPLDADLPDMQMCDAPPANCTATVGELSACLETLPEYTKASLPMLPACEALEIAKLSDYFERPPEPMKPAACTTYENKCPGDSITGDGNQ